MIKFFLCLAFILSSQASQAVVVFKKEDGKVEFKAKGWPSLLRINGKGEGFSGSLRSVDGKFSGSLNFELKTLKTGIDLRDDHLKNKYLKIKENPIAILTVLDLVIPKEGEKKIKFVADLTLNGVTKKVNVVGKVSNKKNKLKVNAKFEMNLSNFDVEIPSFKGITVAEEVKVEVSSKGSWSKTL